ncbi:copper chaperone [Moesziomyces antarcticus T-34]|uniref:Copper chaperone n=1 Tax=Pseudozyma antarctica (strain T-34) TaxID=1151754 RepID=M9MH45_PSEA3|nr:copper chaperone [Moesziomyces antarcticus T-34]
MSEHEYKFDVVMTCSGCSGAVERVLSKLQGRPLPLHRPCRLDTRSHALLPFAWMQGVDSYDVSLESQSVVVRGSAPFDTVLEKIKKTGKEVKSSQVVR